MVHPGDFFPSSTVKFPPTPPSPPLTFPCPPSPPTPAIEVSSALAWTPGKNPTCMWYLWTHNSSPLTVWKSRTLPSLQYRLPCLLRHLYPRPRLEKTLSKWITKPTSDRSSPVMPEKTLVPVIILSEAMLGVEVEAEMSFVASSYSNAEPYRSTEHQVVYPRNHYGLVFLLRQCWWCVSFPSLSRSFNLRFTSPSLMEALATCRESLAKKTAWVIGICVTSIPLCCLGRCWIVQMCPCHFDL